MTPNRKIIHDIRNSLNALFLNSGYLNVFSRAEALEAMEAIETGADQICKLLDQLEATEIEIEPQPHDMLPLIPPEACNDVDSTLNPKL